MDSDSSNEISEVVKRIEDVSRLSTEQLIEISRKLFALVSFCNCEVNKGSDRIVHLCDRFHHHDYEHTPACKCCQKRMLLYYLGRCMEKLADGGRLAQFIDANLSHAKIRDRTYEHIRIGSELIFNIIRHPNAWRNEAKMEEIIQTWAFDFTDLSLEDLSNFDSTIAISVRALMESKSEWKGTPAELLVELKKVAEMLKINTKGNRFELLKCPV